MGETGDSKKGTSRGRFTRMFDREFIEDAIKRKEQEQVDEAELAASERKKRDSRRIALGLELAERFHTRNDHLRTRFPEMTIENPDDFNVRFGFPAGKGQPHPSHLEFQVEISHQGGAFHIHSRIIVNEKVAADRLSFGERSIDFDRVDRFVERRILEFVRRYIGDDA